MKKGKLTALTMAVTMLATAFVGAMTANAEDVLKDKGDVTTGVDLVYNETLSNETERYVDVYVNNASAITSMKFVFNITHGVVTNVAKSELFIAYDDNLGRFDTNGLNIIDKNSITTYVGTFSNSASSSPDNVFNGGYFGRIKFTVADASATFDVTVTSQTGISTSAGKVTSSELDKLTVPAFATAPVEPELPVFDDELAATPIDGLFDEHTDTVPVKAWMTDAIDWSSYKEVKDLKWVITVGGVANEVKATQAELSGDMTVIYALAIAGRADQLETIESVVLK